MALYFYFNETIGDLVYSDQATYDVEGYTRLGEQTNTAPAILTSWVFNSVRANIKTVTKDPAISSQIDVLTSMWSMFGDCSILTSLDLSGFDTSNVTDMNYMFSNCQALKSLDLSSFNTSNVTDMGNMFYGCLTLTSLDLSNFDTSNVTNMSGMFSNCQTLRIIDISPNMSNVLDQLPAATYYDAVTRQPYAKADIPGGSTYVRDLADLDLVATMVQTRMGINKVKDKFNEQAREIQSLQASVSQATSDTGWLYLWQSGSQFVRYRRVGPLVHLWWRVSQPSASYWTCPTPLPEGLRPSGNTYFSAVLSNADGYATNQTALCCVEGSGNVGFQAGSAVSGAFNRGCGCFAAL